MRLREDTHSALTPRPPVSPVTLQHRAEQVFCRLCRTRTGRRRRRCRQRLRSGRCQSTNALWEDANPLLGLQCFRDTRWSCCTRTHLAHHHHARRLVLLQAHRRHGVLAAACVEKASGVVGRGVVMVVAAAAARPLVEQAQRPVSGRVPGGRRLGCLHRSGVAVAAAPSGRRRRATTATCCRARVEQRAAVEPWDEDGESRGGELTDTSRQPQGGRGAGHAPER
jgi:hypothetical protein